MEKLTRRQEVVLEFISRFMEKRRIPPTVREIQEHFGFKSTNAVAEHLAQLEKKGYLRRRPGISRGIEFASGAKSISYHPDAVGVPVLGEIAAGSPTLAEEHIEGYLHLDKTLIRGDGNFLLRVKGDSMKGAGIHDGDFVLVKSEEQAERGQIVVAYLNGEATVKYFYPYRLVPANPRYSPIRVTQEKYPDFRILGKVHAILRIL